MVQTIQLAKVRIEDEDDKELDNGEYLGIEILFASPISVDVNFSGTSTRFDKQLLQITFPGSDGILVQGVNKDDQNNIQEVVGNTKVKIENINTNSIKVVRVTSANGTGWTPLHGISNPSTIVILRGKHQVDDEFGKILWSSTEVWNNGKERKLTGHEEKDPDDSKVMLSAGEGRKLFIDGKGTAFLSGARSRIYFAVNNYNAMMQLTYTHIKSLENLSLRLRSLRNEKEGFGGYGFILHRDSVEAKYQTKYDGDNIDLGSKKLPKELPEDSPVTVRWCVRDEGKKIQVAGWIKYGGDGEFVKVYDELDDKFLDIARDKDTFLKSSTAWIRGNNKEEIPKDVPIKDVSITEIV